MMRCRLHPMKRHAMPDKQEVTGQPRRMRETGKPLPAFLLLAREQTEQTLLASTYFFGMQLRAPVTPAVIYMDDVGGVRRELWGKF